MSSALFTPEGMATQRRIQPLSGMADDTSLGTVTEFAESTSVLVALITLKIIGSHVLRWPLSIEVFKIADYYVAEEHEFGLWSDGVTVDEAIDGIQAFFSHEYSRYISTPNERMDLLARREKKKYIQWVGDQKGAI